MKIREGGQVTIPKELRDRYDLHEGDELEFVPEKDSIRLRKRRDAAAAVASVYGILRGRALTRTTDEYLEEIRGR